MVTDSGQSAPADRPPPARLWSFLGSTVLQPVPALVYLVLLLVAWPAYRLSVGLPTAATRHPATIARTIHASPAASGPDARVGRDATTVLWLPHASTGGGLPVEVRLLRDDETAWRAPLRVPPPIADALLALLLDGTALEPSARYRVELRGPDGDWSPAAGFVVGD